MFVENFNNFNLWLWESILMLVCSCMLISLIFICLQNNPVYAVFSFLGTALLAFSFFLLIGAEFFALLVLIIYIGVITVLFLFVVIMYNIRSIVFSTSSILYFPVVYTLIYKIFWFNQVCVQTLKVIIKQHLHMNTAMFTIDVAKLADLFNTQYFLFLLIGLLLFIAMLGSIVMTYPFFKQYK